MRRRQRYVATHQSALWYLNKYRHFISSIQPENPKTEDEPERAFTIWFQGEENAPELVKACFRSMRRHLKQELVVLDENTLFDWITLPDYVIKKWKEGKMRAAHFSDICRVELLYQHGGIWLDATDFVTAPIPREIIDSDFFVFMSGEKIRGSYSFIQNCFIRAKKNNKLLGIWRSAILKYWENENSVINYFTHQLLFKVAIKYNPVASKLFSKMLKLDQDPTHTLWDEHCDDKYDEVVFKKLTSDAFFQKTNYKDKRLKNLKHGSIAEYVINS